MRYCPIFLLCFLAACSVFKSGSGSSKKLQPIEILKASMTGTFNSAAQAQRDTDFFDITLHMHPIWKDRAGHWLYVEQSVTANQAKPYRQRIYLLEQVDERIFKSSVYTLSDEKAYINAWQTPEKFNALKISDIQLKTGCEVMLKWDGKETFSGATGERTCPSELRGASYATSKVTVFPDKIVSWDQGFNDKGEQVWGAMSGGYEFLKRN